MSGNRFSLGIGPSHPQVMENQFGYSYDRPAAHIREYLSALRPLLRGEQAEHRGPALTAAGALSAPGAQPPPVLLSALGPVMLRIAGEVADGTITVWTGPQAIAEYVTPAITRAADEAGRPAPRIAPIVLLALTNDPDAARQQIAAQLTGTSALPSYRATLDRQGKSGPEETAVVGDEHTVEQALRALADAGATELIVGLPGTDENRARALGLLSALHGQA